MMGGGYSPYALDPMTASYLQYAQLAAQGIYGGIPGQIGQMGMMPGAMYGQPGFNQQLGGFGAQFGRPQIGMDPYAQQAQLASQFGRFMPLQAVPVPVPVPVTQSPQQALH
jgi:hypothetical protein